MDSVYVKYEKLQKSKGYKNSIKSVEKALDKEVKLTTKFNNRFMKEHKNPEKMDILWWEKELGKLKIIEALSDIEMDKMLERLRYKIFAQAIAMKNSNLYQSATIQKEYLDEIIRLVYPNLVKNKGRSE
ncbi:hypothetical protein [Aquimarina sediminis]|uniref:hypothetical protein n=1 Tax=Aquimarina sediminis TaxID=2070536 RepID=UPI000CA02891|nr:hypothetical protein [Aquimarina sediminis]